MEESYLIHLKGTDLFVGPSFAYISRKDHAMAFNKREDAEWYKKRMCIEEFTDESDLEVVKWH
jgi:hypothetical protein